MADATAKTIEVINDDGRTFTVRVIEQGDNYGLNDCLTHEKQKPMVEFFDKGVTPNSPAYGPLGQFVSRYYLSTISEDRITGINLDGGVDVWHVSLENVQDAIAFANTVIANREVA